jgi:deoxyribonuclease-2
VKLHVIGDQGKAVDWFFLYKLPAGATDPTGESRKRSVGYEYVYFDAASKQLPALSPHTLKDQRGALYETLAQIYTTSSTGGRILYNDEKPLGKDNGACGHTKGVLAFDTKSDTAFWLMHSTPKFPKASDPKFPVSGHGNGQSFLCITLRNVADAEKIATVMHQQTQPQTYGCVIPKSLANDSPLRILSQGVDLDSKDPPVSGHVRTKGGHTFRVFAKNRAWDDDLWRDLVAIELGVDISVETWRRLALSRDAEGGKEAKGDKEDVDDVRYINLEHLGIPYEWHFTKDHAKLGTAKEYDWIVGADINRDESQAKRGGGALAFQSRLLWEGLTRAEVIYDPTADLEYQKELAKKTSKPVARTNKGQTRRGGSRSLNVPLDTEELAALENVVQQSPQINTLSDAVKQLIRQLE